MNPLLGGSTIGGSTVYAHSCRMRASNLCKINSLTTGMRIYTYKISASNAMPKPHLQEHSSQRYLHVTVNGLTTTCRDASKKTFHTTAFNHRRYCMVQPLFDRCVNVARPSLNRSISAVGLVQTRYAPLHNYRVYVTLPQRRRYAVPQYWAAYVLKWFVYRPVAAPV